MTVTDEVEHVGTDAELRGLRSENKAFCISCRSLVRLLTPLETGQRFKANWAEFSRLVDLGVIHRVHNRRGEIRVCSGSLEQQRSKEFERTVLLQPCSA